MATPQLIKPNLSKSTKGAFRLANSQFFRVTCVVPRDWKCQKASKAEPTRDHDASAPFRNHGERFRALRDQWKRETMFMSSARDIILNDAYQRIISMGERAVPLILAELQDSPAAWFWALTAITGEDPVREQHRGNVQLMAQDWIEWSQSRQWNES